MIAKITVMSERTERSTESKLKDGGWRERTVDCSNECNSTLTSNFKIPKSMTFHFNNQKEYYDHRNMLHFDAYQR